MACIKVTRRFISPLMFVALGTIASASPSTTSPFEPGRVWTHKSPPSTWIPFSVSIGNHGSQAFFGVDGFGGFSRLLLASEADPAQSVWQDGGTTDLRRGTRVVSFDDDRNLTSGNYRICHASLECIQPALSSPWTPRVRFFCAQGGQHGSAYQFPMSIPPAATPSTALCASNDGQCVAAAVYDPLLIQTRIAILRGFSSTPTLTQMVATHGSIVSMDLSSDGSTLAILSVGRLIVIDTVSGNQLLTAINYEGTTQSLALSANGSVLVHCTATGKVSVSRRIGDSFTEAISYMLGVPETICGHVAITDDGSRLACGWDQSPAYLITRVQLLDVSGSQAIELMQDTITATGTYDDVTQDIEISSDATRICVGLDGDQFHLVPEVHVYSQNPQTSSWVHTTYDVPGSVEDLDLSQDGKMLVVASKAVHNNEIGGGGQVDLYQLDNADLSVEGVPIQGSTVNLHMATTPNSPLVLVRNTALANHPMTFEGIGTLFIRRVGLTSSSSTVASAQGTVTIPFAITDPVGTTIYVQGFASSPRRLTKDMCVLTVLP